jgi:acetyl esterase/lipase
MKVARRRLILLMLCALATSLPGLASGLDAPGAEFISLDGKPMAAGNPIEDSPGARLVLRFKAPVLWLLRTKAAKPSGTVLLCPGGAYICLEMQREGENTARALNEMGFDVVILEYHIGSGAPERDLALADALEAFRLVKAKGVALGLHPARMELMGYSAGGHLAARTAAALGPREQPDGVILVYPAYLDERAAGTNKPRVAPPAKPGRLFGAIAANDHPEWVKGCEEYVEAWKSAGGCADFHLLPEGGHGFGMAANLADSNQHWPDLLRTFLVGAEPK